MTRIWEDTPKRGETYGGWFYSKSRDGHIYTVAGGFKTHEQAKKASEA